MYNEAVVYCHCEEVRQPTDDEAISEKQNSKSSMKLKADSY
jgi:hypothetical protein